MRASKAIVAVSAAVGSILLAAGCSSSSSTPAASSASGSTTNWATCSSVAACGGMNALVAAAEKEGKLNVITLPSNWANYGTIMKDFTAKYGIKITDANPEGSSANELTAIKQLKGQSSAPDVVDVGPSFAATGETDGYWAPYEVQTWNDIPAAAKAANGDYYSDYGGYVAIGYNSTVIKTPPTSFASLLTGAYKNQVAIDGNPTQTGSAFAAVYAAALANGGSLTNIAPGVTYFKNLKAKGNFVPVEGTPATVQSGQTPILIWWDYLLNSEITASGNSNFKIVIPSDGVYAGYYDQAINKTGPNPAAARLWEEYLYSTTGQNLFLQGSTRPIELSSMVAAGTEDKAAYASLPAVPGSGSLTLPTIAEQTTAGTVVAQLWPSVSG